MVALRPDGPGERTARVGSGFEAVEHVAEIIARLPAELASRPLIDINPVDLGKHSPTAPGVLRLVAGHPPTHHVRSVPAQLGKVVAQEGRARAHDVAAETDRGSLLDGEHAAG